ncbi:MAG: gamma-glutamyltransferase, partial [Propionibacteriaceae bacterium]|nr:gamma-glutamyltransferase [Propionibacteriaceae bacterium]
GVPAGAWHLWQRWGRLDWADIVAPGRQASLGTAFPATHARLLPTVASAFAVGDGVAVYRRPDGSFLQAGDQLVHGDHYRAYELLADDPEAFYYGDYARAMVSAVADGGAMSMADLEAYRVIESQPRSVSFHGFTVHARGDDLDDVLGTMARAAMTVNADPLTHPDAALALVAALRSTQRRAETTNLVAVDEQGNGCVITTSLGLGSGVWVPGYGVHLNSMLGEGELIREHRHPGVRMGSMMSPLLGLDDHDELILLAGAAGGSRIRQSLVQTVLRILTGSTPQEAIDAPRLAALPSLVRLEPGFSDEVIARLQQAGNEVLVAGSRDAYFGGVSAIGTLGGGADPRRSGVVIML